MIKRIIACLLSVTAVLAAFSACGENPIKTERVGVVSEDSGSYEDYYSKLSYEVKADSGIVTEQMYYLYTDSEYKNAIGKKNIYYDAETGEMFRYTVALGEDYCEKIIDYTRGYTTTTYSEMFYGEDEKLTRATWENTFTDDDGVLFCDTGEQTYYPDGATVKSFWQERYKDNVKYESVSREYDENGNIISEVIE